MVSSAMANTAEVVMPSRFRRCWAACERASRSRMNPAFETRCEPFTSPSMSPETLDVLAEAIRNRDVKGSHLVSNAGFIRDRDALSQAAQHLLNLEGITTSAVFAIADDTIYLAARSKDIRLNIGKVLQDAFDDVGEVVGHSTDASAEIPLGIFTGLEITGDNRETLLNLTEEAVRSKLFEAMGVESGSGESANGN